MTLDLNSIATFVVVAETANFRAAADRLGVTRSAVSQTIRRLEERMGIALVQRTTRSVGLTEAGERLHRGVAPAVEDIVTALEVTGDMRDRPAGLLRLAVSSIAERFIAGPLLASFADAFPDVELDVLITDRELDLVAEGFVRRDRVRAGFDAAFVDALAACLGIEPIDLLPRIGVREPGSAPTMDPIGSTPPPGANTSPRCSTRSPAAFRADPIRCGTTGSAARPGRTNRSTATVGSTGRSAGTRAHPPLLCCPRARRRDAQVVMNVARETLLVDAVPSSSRACPTNSSPSQIGGGGRAAGMPTCAR